MAELDIKLNKNKKVYFASDFHLGLAAFNRQEEIKREKKVVRWLSSIEKDAEAIFLVGDIYDFWFEYNQVVPKGYVRFLGKIANLVDNGIPIYFFTGNHDLWMFQYSKEELGVEVIKKPMEVRINKRSFLIGHGDGLGPGDNFYKFLKKIFTNRFVQWMFKWLHPDVGMALARSWSSSSRIRKSGSDKEFLGDEEFLVQFCKKVEENKHHDYYIFGHRHFPIGVEINEKSTYFNLGEWVFKCTFGEFDGESFKLKTFEGKP